MTEADTKLLNRLDDDIEFGPTRHGEKRPHAMKKLIAAFEAGRRSAAPAPQPEEPKAG